MQGLLLLRVLAAAQGSGQPVSALNSAWPSALPWNYQIQYTTIGGKRCSMADFANYVEVYSDDTILTGSTTIQSKLCTPGDTGYCALGSTDPWCLGDDQTFGANYAFCGSPDLCKKACDASSECYGVETVTAPGVNRCYLLRRECQSALLAGTLAEDPSGTYKYQAKLDKQELSGAELCPLGVAVEGYGMHDKVGSCGLNGLYEAVAGDEGLYLGPTGCSALRWSETGCGWGVTVDVGVDPGVPADTGCWHEAASCRNHVEAANWIFGYAPGSAGYLEDICDVTAAWLDDPGYCGNAAWRALCPQSCVGRVDLVYPSCHCAAWETGDNVEAATYVASMLELGPGAECPALASLCGTDAVVGRLCAGTCAGRRLAARDEALAAALQAKLGQRFAQGFRKDLESRSRRAAETRALRAEAAGRRLAATEPKLLYSTWAVVDKLGLACRDFTPEQASRKRPETSRIAADELYDIHALTVPVEGFRVDKSCPLQGAYHTTSGTYCSNNNLEIAQRAGDYPSAAEHLCFRKCLAEDSLGTAGQDGVDADGNADYCSGADTGYNHHSNALCAPREVCEQLCDELEDCHGFEMHTSFPRCYLNRDRCDAHAPGRVQDPEYDAVSKGQDSVAYKSHTGATCEHGASAEGLTYEPAGLFDDNGVFASKCGGGGLFAGWACLPREDCEAICTADPDCAGFEVTKGFDPATQTRVAPQACSFRKLHDLPRTRRCSNDNLFDGDRGPFSFSIPLAYATWSASAAANLEDGGSEYVEKKLTAGEGSGQRYITPCEAQVSGSPDGYDGTWTPRKVGKDAECDGLSYSGSCYVPADGAEIRLAWAGDAAFDERGGPSSGPTRGLDRRSNGWVVQARTGGEWASRHSYEYPAYLGYAASAPVTPVVLAGAEALYAWEPPVDAAAGLEYTCLSYYGCGTLSTCVLPYGRFRSELAQQYRNHDSTHPLRNAHPQVLQDLFDPTTYTPKTLISVERAVAFVGAEKWEWAQEIYRNVPGHLRIQLQSIGSLSTAVVTLVSADAAAQAAELGVSYAPPATHEPWYTDLIRVERFRTGGEPLGPDQMEIDVYAPIDGELELLHADQGFAAVPCARNHAKAPGWWTCAIVDDGDYIGTTQARCPEMPGGSGVKTGATCGDTRPKAECTPECAGGFGAGGALTCALGSWQGQACHPEVTYSPETSFFRLTHRSRMDYGWRIQDVAAYTDKDCTIPVQGGVDVEYGASSTTQAGFGSLAGQKEWWTQRLNVNPHEVDETHGGAVHLDFRAGGDVQCVKVKQRAVAPASHGGKPRQYFPQEQVLQRGWRSNPRQALAFEPAETSLRGWTQVWTSEPEPEGTCELNNNAPGGQLAYDANGYSCSDYVGHEDECGQSDTPTFDSANCCACRLSDTTYFRPTCGIDAVIYGELLSAEAGVPSACHCRQLCVDTEACVSWKWRKSGGGTCHLQANIVSIEGQSEPCADHDWVSGDTGIRFGTGVRHLGVIDTHSEAAISWEVEGPWSGFDLVLKGHGFPTGETKPLHATTAPRQRVKLVAHGEACAESPVAPGVQGIGCNHPLICMPRPSVTDSTQLRWSGLSIKRQPAETSYDICYTAGETSSRWSWHRVGTLSVPGTSFRWSTNPAVVSRKTPTFTLAVHGDMLGHGGADLRLKVLALGHDDCTLAGSGFMTPGSAADEFAEDLASVTWDMTSPAGFDSDGAFTGVGRYTVCLSEDEGATYHPIPSADALQLAVVGEDDDSSHPRKVWYGQRASGRAGSTATVVLKGHRLRLPSTSALRVGAACGDGETARVHEAQSTEDGYAFDVEFEANQTSAKLCYCDDQADTTPGNASDASATYHVSSNSRCTEDLNGAARRLNASGLAAAAEANGTIAKADVAAEYHTEFCQAKCPRGCVGADCHCQSFDHAAPDEGLYGPLCVDAVTCRAACEATGDCAGFDFEAETSFCWLFSECAAPTDAEGFDSWARVDGATCTDDADFVEVGTVDLTSRPFVDHDWVIQPHRPASIEVVGEGLDWTTDRVMIIDSTGICGVSGPTKSTNADQHAFNHWVAKNKFEDPPSSPFGGCSRTLVLMGAPRNCEDLEWLLGTPLTKEQILSMLQGDPNGACEGCWLDPEEEKKLVWVERDQSYCTSNNIPPSELVGDTKRHQCHHKCVVGAPCEGDDCFCEGLYPGFDKPDSPALCLDLEGCKAACTADENCFGFDMHHDQPRCFLNTMYDGPGGCPEQVQLGALGQIEHYSFWFKHPHENDRRLDALQRRDDRRLLAVEDGGLSWHQVLRFTGIQFSTGGTFTACFCDSSVKDGASLEVCREPKDYAVAIGTVHVSGVECLLQQSKFQRGSCVAHFHEGDHSMRCYPGDPPAVQYPSPQEQAQVVFPNKGLEAAEGVLSSYCLYGPEEETRDSPLCQWMSL